MDDLAELEAATHALPSGWHGTFFRTVGSTQDEARAAAAAGAPSRSIFVADYQAAGRGRQGRVWLAPPGTSLLMSILVRDAPRPGAWQSTALAGVALSEAIEMLMPSLQPRLKWPNDVMLDSKKVAGVLAEASSDGRVQTTIVGVGVNVHSSIAELGELARTATSLRIAANASVHRAEVLKAFVERLDAWLKQSEAELRNCWQTRLWGRGQRLRMADSDGETEVVVVGAESDGALRVQLPDGTVRRTFTAELIL